MSVEATPSIELISPGILTRHPETLARIEQVASELNLPYGWHYFLDLVWLAERVQQCGLLRGSLILDAGAGMGCAQFVLAGLGYNVISVDFTRRTPSAAMLRRFNITVSGGSRDEYKHAYLSARRIGLRASLASAVPAAGAALTALRTCLNRLAAAMAPLPGKPRSRSGTIDLHRADLRAMTAMADASVDAVVSVSALEHNSRDDVRAIMGEIRRILRPGGRVFITTSASGGEDRYHEPSQGWCYSERSLRDLFVRGSAACSSDVSHYGEVMTALKESLELSRRLHPLYFRSGNNGMPWGRWDPQYCPVGITCSRENS